MGEVRWGRKDLYTIPFRGSIDSGNPGEARGSVELERE